VSLKVTRDIATGVLNGDASALARGLRLVDDERPGSVELLRHVFSHTGRAHVLGVTGVPGAGKSTLIDALITLLRAQGRRVAVLAVDPSSPVTGGAILGDRIRMQRHCLDEGVFIRSVASRGQLGGVTRSARGMIRLLDAAGYDPVILETVGVGQDAVEITQLADTVAVVLAPGLGDDLQAAKAGVLEVADIFVVNKADREGADALEHTLRSMQQIGQEAHAPSGAVAPDASTSAWWTPPVVRTVGTTETGIDSLWAACDAHRTALQSPFGEMRRNEQLQRELAGLVTHAVRSRLEAHASAAILQQAKAVLRHAIDPYEAAENATREALAAACADVAVSNRPMKESTT
jgi:LAO/AO transport system kinase